eukprot:3766943-Pyramimonas_sp.AAC.1
MACPRTDTVGRLRGGMAEMFRECLKKLLGSPLMPDLRFGVSLRIHGEPLPRLVTSSVTMIIQDERAHKFSTAAKGVGGHTLCALCANVVGFRCPWLPHPALVSSSETDVSKFRLYTDDDIRAIQR